MTSKDLNRRGRHKIFLGALPGVGKTYKMLSEAKRRLLRGEDIVIGFVEPHGRPATTQLMEGFEQVPLKRLEYRGKTFYELDTAEVIKRKPDWVLIDELAHTNIPGTTYEKRWQSVEEILSAGINVVSTVNIQHLESLNDTVYEITDVRVRETLPDSVLHRADEVELVDLTPDALINRLKRGDIYHQEKIPQALDNFFRRGNIVALRELALKKTTEEVDNQLQQYIADHKMPQGNKARDHVVVCITPRHSATKLIRRGYRLASRMQGDLTVLYVSVPGAALNKKEETVLKAAFDLAKNLGALIVERQGEIPAKEIISYVDKVNPTLIILGQSARSRWEEIFRGSIINRIMRETKNIDIFIIADPDRG